MFESLYSTDPEAHSPALYLKGYGAQGSSDPDAPGGFPNLLTDHRTVVEASGFKKEYLPDVDFDYLDECARCTRRASGQQPRGAPPLGPMDTISFGGTGLPATPVGFGGAPFALLGTPASETDTLLGALLDLGVGLLDTAACYGGGDSEEAIGRAISGRRDEYTLVSKCGHQVDAGDAEAWSPALIASSIDRSLRRMRTDRVDVMLLHSCKLEVLERGEVFEALRRARDAGKIRCFGYSGDNEAATYAARQPDVAAIETSISIADQCNIDGVLAVARERNLGVLAKRPIANAAWKQAEQQPGFYGDYASTYHGRLAAMGVAPADLGYDGDAAAVWPEIALRFTLAQPGLHSAIIGTTNPAHVKANIAAAEKGPLPPDQVAALRAAFAAAQSAAGEAWTGQT